MSTTTYWSIALVTVGLSYIGFAFYVLAKKKADAISRIFLVFALAIAAWNLSLTALVGQLVTSKTPVIVLDRITYATGPIILMGLIFYLIALRGASVVDEIRKSKVLMILTFYAAVNLILSPTNLISNNQGDDHMVIGKLMPFYGIFALASLIYALYLCYIGWRRGPEESRGKFWFVLLGLVLAAICSMIFNVILPILGYPAFPMIGALSTVFVVWFLGLGAIGVYIAGGVLGVLGSALVIIFFSSVIIAVAVFLMFILLAALLGSPK